jgi:hypothetical protein
LLAFSEKKSKPEAGNEQRRKKLTRSGFASIPQQVSPDDSIQHIDE